MMNSRIDKTQLLPNCLQNNSNIATGIEKLRISLFSNFTSEYTDITDIELEPAWEIIDEASNEGWWLPEIIDSKDALSKGFSNESIYVEISDDNQLSIPIVVTDLNRGATMASKFEIISCIIEGIEQDVTQQTTVNIEIIQNKYINFLNSRNNHSMGLIELINDIKPVNNPYFSQIRACKLGEAILYSYLFKYYRYEVISYRDYPKESSDGWMRGFEALLENVSHRGNF